MTADTPAYFKNQRKDVVPLLPASCSRVLEIGCGAGVFRGNLPSQVEYWGVEPSSVAADHARRVLDKVFVGIYEQFEDQLPANGFDLIVCNDVIEHMPDHDAFLRSIKAKLAPGGCLVLSVPNVRYVWNLFEVLVRQEWRYRDDGILDRTHLRFFTEKSLARTVAEHGFVVDACRGLSPYRPESLARHVLLAVASLVLGRDVRFMQLGMRIRPAA